MTAWGLGFKMLFQLKSYHIHGSHFLSSASQWTEKGRGAEARMMQPGSPDPPYRIPLPRVTWME